MRYRSAADRDNAHASGPDFGPAFGRMTQPEMTDIGDGYEMGGPKGGGGYDGPALLALANDYLQQKIALSPDNPYKTYVDARIPKADFGTMGIGDPQAMYNFAKLGYGRAIDTALRYEMLRGRGERIAPGPASPFGRLVQMHQRGGTSGSAA